MIKRSGSVSLTSVAVPDPGSGSFLTPGSRIRNRFFPIPDPKPIFWKLRDSLVSIKFYNSLKVCPNFFLQNFKNQNIFNYVKFVAKKRYDKKFVFTPGSGINIPDPQHCLWLTDAHPEGPKIYGSGSATLEKLTVGWQHPSTASILFQLR